MSDKKCSSGLRAVLAIVSLALFATAIAASQERVLHNFTGTDGASPYAGLVWDAAGNLYGTTIYGGTHNLGTVFELTPSSDGNWSEKVLYNFGSRSDGSLPYASLIWDAAGNLYGTTIAGGSLGGGTVFELTPAIGGVWSEKVLHAFGWHNGNAPYGGLVWDADGNLFGTTTFGGSHGVGIVFKLTPNTDGTWSEILVHIFGHADDGQQPVGNLIWDAAGNLYGVTHVGGAHNGGTVFELTPNPDGGSTEKVLHSFGTGTDGHYPVSSLVWDAAGNLYGTTYSGGAHHFGTVYKLTPKVDGGSTERVLHHFGYRSDGQRPNASLIWDANGNLYSTTASGGASGGGTVFELTPKASGGSTEKVLYSFEAGTTNPCASLIWDAAGNLYSTTYAGGTGHGMVFEVLPHEIFYENFDELTPQLDVTAVGLFHAIDGTNVDINGDGIYGYLCQPPTSGHCIDLDGSNGNSQGVLQTVNGIVLQPGTNYYLSFDLVGGHQNTTSATVDFGPYHRTFVLTSNDDSSGVVTNALVTVTTETTAFLTFTSNTPGNMGTILDNVSISEQAQ